MFTDRVHPVLGQMNLELGCSALPQARNREPIALEPPERQARVTS